MSRVIALSGGVGGAKLALGLSRILMPDDLTIVANTGDDFEHLGFYICPDIDTLLYTLGGVCNTETGWGRADETWQFMEELKSTNTEEAWFLLGDKDLETHLYRTAALGRGDSLTDVTARLAAKFGVLPRIVPMSDDPVRTHVLADMAGEERWFPFQEYFVRYRCEPRTLRIEFRGCTDAAVSPQLLSAFEADSVKAVIVCPSNPYLSIDPILAVPGIRGLIESCAAPVVAVSPVVAGHAIKGPTAKIMQELGLQSDVETIARHYDGLIDGLVIDREDAGEADRVEAHGIRVTVTNTVMRSLSDRKQLASDVLEFAAAST